MLVMMIMIDGKPLRTLIVERQALIAKALHSYLGCFDELRVVGDAGAVRESDVQTLGPEFILFGSDNAVQSIDEALAIARSAVPAVRLCVLSNYADRRLMRNSFAAGAQGFIVKDISPSEFSVALRMLAAGKTYVDPRVAATRRGRSGGIDAQPLAQLTARESEVLGLIACGCSNREISTRLEIVEKTVKNHVSRILNKLHLTRRTQAAVYALNAGFAEGHSARAVPGRMP